jgi:hypothetical protein
MVGVVGFHSSSLRVRNAFACQHRGTNLIVISSIATDNTTETRSWGFRQIVPNDAGPKEMQKRLSWNNRFTGKKHNRVTLKYFQEVDHELRSTDRWCTIGKRRTTFKTKRAAQFRRFLTKPIFWRDN